MLSIAYATATAGTDDRPLGAVTELISQRYCFGDAEVFSILLRLHVKYTNRTDKTLILDKEIGKAWYEVTVARNVKDLAAGKYEYNPNIDWFFTNKDQLPKKPSLATPGPDFAVLTPGQTFESEIDTSVVAQYDSGKDVAGAIRSGVHIFQMQLSAWNRPGLPSEFEKSWRQKGQIVTALIKTEPMEIRVPSNPKVENDCK
ncbi:MAG TPA: hypothetical protein VG051_07230 [Candidatus Acidoferrum sp.]|nr:hypothetical protein [Candidatus Acidoferrum sp.]